MSEDKRALAERLADTCSARASALNPSQARNREVRHEHQLFDPFALGGRCEGVAELFALIAD